MDRRQTAIAALAGLSLFLSAPASAQTDALKFFKNYFVTGDYQVAGVGLSGTGVNGFATGSISFNNVPADAEIVAAQLYFQVVTKASFGSISGVTGATFNGLPLSTPDGSVREGPQ